MRFKILLCVLALSACNSANPPPMKATASGNPEVLIKNSTAVTVKEKAANFFINEGYSIVSSNDLGVEFDKQSENIALDLLASCRYCARPRARVKLAVLQNGKDVRVVVDPYWLVNPGSASEKRISADGDRVMEGFQAKLERALSK